MDFEDISPIAVIAGVVGAGIGWFMVGRIDELPAMWKILTPLASGLGGYFIMAKMANN
ncbi:MAG: hypothetical protein IH845_05315 [Nanoarchaeota archaeon]|nr:hypothetical protein [Nanoarchaeota archaeon]